MVDHDDKKENQEQSLPRKITHVMNICEKRYEIQIENIAVPVGRMVTETRTNLDRYSLAI